MEDQKNITVIEKDSKEKDVTIEISSHMKDLYLLAIFTMVPQVDLHVGLLLLQAMTMKSITIIEAIGAAHVMHLNMKIQN